MGTNFVLACVSEKTFIELPSSKSTEIILDPFTQKLITNYLLMEIQYDEKSFRFFDTCNQHYVDIYSKFENVTWQVVYDLFEDGWKPSKYEIKFIFEVFEEAKQMKPLAEYIVKWADLKNEIKKKLEIEE